VKNPTVTFVTPSYNQGRFIRATIESVLSQGYPDLEYIIMDGGSTDETAAVVRDYSSRLTFISERDHGQSHAINKGFRMARGSLVAWLNSDDVILPGAVAHAVRAFHQEPESGAVYGEGYQIDVDGNIKCRFSATEPFNLWKLIYLWDYVLQQTVYFRKDVIEEVGYLDETLNWGMDWDLLIRIGRRYPLRYIPEFMACLREYPDAKTFSGGSRRFNELVKIMRRHGRRLFPPGYVVYGLDTYEQIWCNWIRRWFPDPLAEPVVRRFSCILRRHIDRTVEQAQGLYADGWATTEMHYMLPAGSGDIQIEGEVPDLAAAGKTQTLTVVCNRKVVAVESLPPGCFQIVVPGQSLSPDIAAELTIRASCFIVPKQLGARYDDRRLAFRLDRLQRTQTRRTCGAADLARTSRGKLPQPASRDPSEVRNESYCDLIGPPVPALETAGSHG
jgi:glycosyltransferase involved in cell wall biosynthesis